MLPKEPSFCIYNTEDGVDELKENQDLVRSVTIGDIISDIGSSDFSFGKKGMGLIEEDENEDGGKRVFYEVNELGFEESEPVISSKYLGGVESEPLDFDGNGDVEEYYKRVLKEDPSNPLFLRNYAQLLQSKGDLLGAEEYYSRAILADPTDGETISQYAMLIWQLHRDKDKASTYFKRAVQASPEDGDVLAAYARFLWQTEEDEDGEEDETLGDHNGAPPLQGVMAANA
uniref:O-linked n-acetylglucosamine transferase, ogt n=1 Tax=Solanum tuberosum TaxID=4113 RepID=M0ZMK8_SOLTU